LCSLLRSESQPRRRDAQSASQAFDLVYGCALASALDVVDGLIVRDAGAFGQLAQPAATTCVVARSAWSASRHPGKRVSYASPHRRLRELAERAGIANYQTIDNIERARQRASVDQIESLARALGVSPAWLAFGTKE
jgi:transcriptional regulator with XRE-family HTH domain